MNVTVVGAGYVGLVTGVCLAEKGHQVCCLDTDAAKIELLNHGVAPIFEEGLQPLMHKNHARLRYTTDQASAYRDAEIIVIGVGTPEKKDGSANLAFVYAASQAIGQFATRDAVVLLKSTVPIGTNDEVEKIIRKNLAPGIRIEVASNPEFLSQGTAVHDTLHPSRIVIGCQTEKVAKTLLALYQNFDCEKIVTDRKSAELIKYASNDFLALKISYINEIANLCEIVGADIEDVAAGMGLDARIGSRFLKAGIGYGGSCFPKDTKALHWLASMHDYELKTIKAAIEVNEQQKLKLIKRARKIVPDFAGLTVAVLGVTFKSNTDDLREAPSLVNIPVFLEEGATVKVYDPVGMPNFERQYPEVCFCTSIDAALEDADLCFILTDWAEIKECPLKTYVQKMKTPIVLDGRNCYALDAIPNGMFYYSIGRPEKDLLGGVSHD